MMHSLNGKTILAGIIGYPVGHSRSPLLHNYWCHKYGINGAYVPLPVKPGTLKTALAGLMAAGFRGVSVTIPYKEEAFSLCDELTETAKKAGSVNMILFKDGHICGDCTDGVGFYTNLCSSHGPQSGNCLILGSGGAARAIAAYLLERNFSIMMSNRTKERADQLISTLGQGRSVVWDEYPHHLKEVDLLVNATSLGMGKNAGDEEENYWQEVFAKANLEDSKKITVADSVYTPLETPLLRIARQHKYHTIEGLGMLLYQGCEGFYQWFGVRPEVDEEAFELLKRDLGL